MRLYGVLADRLPRRRLINGVTGFFVGCLILFYVLARLSVPLGVILFAWTGIFSSIVVAQFWSFANDVYTEDEGKRLFAIIAFGASLGAVLGSLAQRQLIVSVGLYLPLLAAALLLVVALQITNYVDSKERLRTEADLPKAETTSNLSATGTFRREDIARALQRGQEEPDEQREAHDAGSTKGIGGDSGTKRAESAEDSTRKGAFGLVLRTRYLLLIALLVVILNWINTNGEYILARIVSANAREAVAAGTAGGLSVEQYIGTFYAGFFAGVNLTSLVIQLFLVSRVIKYLGVGIGILILPVISLGAYSLIAVYPVLSYVRWAKTAENSTDYSLNNTMRNVLFLPTTREQKYKAKQVIDSFCQRGGDVLSAASVFVGTSYLALGAAGFAGINLLLIIAWLALAFFIGRDYKRLVTTGQPPRT